MDIEERLKCIKHINPEAHCVVWEGGIVKYDAVHTGVKPTLEECEAVLFVIQGQMALEKEGQLNEKKINLKMRELAIGALGNELPEGYK